jgi:hypothetical protein
MHPSKIKSIVNQAHGVAKESGRNVLEIIKDKVKDIIKKSNR